MRLLLTVLVVLLLLLQFPLWSGDGGLPEVWDLRERIAEQEAANRELQARNDALEAEVDNLREGLDAIEERARNELGLVGEGEIFFQVIELERSRAEDERSGPDEAGGSPDE